MFGAKRVQAGPLQIQRVFQIHQGWCEYASESSIDEPDHFRSFYVDSMQSIVRTHIQRLLFSFIYLHQAHNSSDQSLHVMTRETRLLKYIAENVSRILLYPSLRLALPNRS